MTGNEAQILQPSARIGSDSPYRPSRFLTTANNQTGVENPIPITPYDGLLKDFGQGISFSEALERGSRWLFEPHEGINDPSCTEAFLTFSRSLINLERVKRDFDANKIRLEKEMIRERISIPKKRTLQADLEPGRSDRPDGYVKPDLGKKEQKKVGEGRSNEKRPVYESDMPWWEGDQKHIRQECAETCRLLDIYAKDYKQVREWIKSAPNAPPLFPESEWEHIIRGKPVDLDFVLSGLHGAQPARKRVELIGGYKVVRTEPARHVETGLHWVYAWDATSAAYKVAFPHRAAEVSDYGRYILSLFSARNESVHNQVIIFDKSVRTRVGGGRSVLLSDSLNQA